MSTILITGAAGRIGRLSTPHLQTAGHRIVGFDRVDDPGTCDVYHRGELTDATALREAMRGCSAVLHLAANPGTHADFLRSLVEPNLIGAWRVLEIAAELGVERLILASSINAVNGPRAQASLPAAESLGDPGNPYGLTKWWLEQAGALFQQSHGMTVICARICRFIGYAKSFAWLRDHPEDTEPHTSPDDWVRFLHCALATRTPYAVVHVQSLPRDGIWRLDWKAGQAAIGYMPQDQFPAGCPQSWRDEPPYDKHIPDWPEPKRVTESGDPRRVLITGAGGHIGRAVSAALTAHGWTVVGLDRHPDPGGCAVWHQADICDRPAVDAAMTGCGAVLHLAARPNPDTTFDRHLDANYRGLWTVLESARDADVAQVVLASSLHALGGPGRAFDPQGGFPLSAYGLSKRFAEQAGLLFHQRHGMRVIALRIGWCSENPASLRDLLRLGYLDAYLSMRDACTGCEAALSARDIGFAIWHAHGGLDKLPFAVDNDRWRAKDHWPEGLPSGVLDAVSVRDAIPTR